MLTQDLLNELFAYDPNTGELTRKIPRGRQPAGSPAGYVDKAAVQIRVDGKLHKAHRLIWFMVYGNIPNGKLIDHVNGDPTDNRLVNLRLADKAGNAANSKIASNNTSGFKGVAVRGDRFLAAIYVDGKSKHLGVFATPQDAATAYDTAAVAYFGEFARTNKAMGLL